MMKRSLAIVTLVILALAVPASLLAQGNKAETEKEVRAFLDASYQANSKVDVAAFDKLTAEEFTMINDRGGFVTKAEMLANAKAGKVAKPEALEWSDIKIRIYGNTAVITGMQNSKATATSDAMQTRWTRVLVKRGGSWRAVQFQVTRIAPKS